MVTSIWGDGKGFIKEAVLELSPKNVGWGWGQGGQNRTMRAFQEEGSTRTAKYWRRKNSRSHWRKWREVYLNEGRL